MRRLLYLSGLGASPLHNACLEGNEEKLAQLLLNHDLNINEQNMVRRSY